MGEERWLTGRLRRAEGGGSPVVFVGHGGVREGRRRRGRGVVGHRSSSLGRRKVGARAVFAAAARTRSRYLCRPHVHDDGDNDYCCLSTNFLNSYPTQKLKR